MQHNILTKMLSMLFLKFSCFLSAAIKIRQRLNNNGNHWKSDSWFFSCTSSRRAPDSLAGAPTGSSFRMGFYPGTQNSRCCFYLWLTHWIRNVKILATDEWKYCTLRCWRWRINGLRMEEGGYTVPQLKMCNLSARIRFQPPKEKTSGNYRLSFSVI